METEKNGAAPMRDGESKLLGSTELEFQEAERQGLLPTEINRFGDHFLKFLLAAPEAT
jgi:hypothetical protein